MTEILDRKCKTYDSILIGATACITYKENDEIRYLVNTANLDDEIVNEYFITKDYSLYYILSSDMDEISQYDMKLLKELEAGARKPETSAEWLLAYESDELIEEKFREMGFLDEETPIDAPLCN